MTVTVVSHFSMHNVSFSRRACTQTSRGSSSIAVGGKAIRMTKEGRIYGLAFGYAHTRPPKKEIMTSYSGLRH